jgi:hypothetical protein
MSPTTPASHALGSWPVATLAIALTGLAGCGGGDDASSKTTTSQQAAVQRGADLLVVNRIPLHSTIDQVVARVGRPARIERRGVPFRKSKRSKTKLVAQTCYIYGVKGGLPTDRISMCFIGGELLSVTSARAKRGNAATDRSTPLPTPP